MIGLALITIVSVYFATETRQKAGSESADPDHRGVAVARQPL
jgi:hypothetical protein